MKILIAALTLALLQGCAAIDHANAKARAEGRPTLGEILENTANRAAAGADAYYSTKAQRPLPYPQQLCSAVTRNCNPPVDVRIVP